jgi:hypothetical protein
MIDLNNLILGTDTDTLKNDGSAQGGVTLAGGSVIPVGGIVQNQVDLTVGKANSSAIAYFENNKEGARTYSVVFGASLTRSGVVLGFPATYSIFITATRIGANTVRMTAFATNPYSDPLTMEATAEVFLFLAKTIVEPF